MEDKKMHIDYLPMESLKANDRNPNQQKEIVFNKLVENIEEIGFVEPVMVRPLEDGQYEIVSGHHRVEAAKIVGYEEVPCIIQHDFDEDQSNFQIVRMNVLKGEMDPMKFTNLFNDMAEKYGEDLTKDMMAMVDQKAFDKLYVSVKEELPKDLQKKLESTKKEIKDVDGLSRILNTMFSSYGDTLQYSFMVFDYSGKDQLWIQMENKTKKKLFDEVVPELSVEGIDANDFFNVLVEKFGTDEEVLAEAKQRTDKRGIEKDEEEVNFN